MGNYAFFQPHIYRNWAWTRPQNKSQQTPKNQYHTDYIIYHNAMALEFSDKRNFSLPLTTRHSIMDASTKSKAQGRQGNPEAEGRVGEMMFLNRTGEHMCALLFKTWKITWSWYLAYIFRACSVEAPLQLATSRWGSQESSCIHFAGERTEE